MRGAQPVELGARLAAELLDVGEALGREQRGARDLALEQGVRADGHAVHEPLDVVGLQTGARERALHGVEHAARLVVGRGGRLRGDEPVRRGENSVGERTADVYAEYHTADASSGGDDLAASKSSSRCWCDGQYLLPGSGTRWHAVPLRVVA